MNPLDYIKRLNEQQKEAYDKVYGPMIVMAPAGTGKTDVIALRVYNAYSCGVKPEEMLLLTFTNRAAKSMKLRLENILGDITQHIKISTFHGLCGYILRQEAVNLFLSHDFVVIDDDDSRTILKEIVVERNFKSILYYKEEQLIVDFIRLAREYGYLNDEKLDIKSFFEKLVFERNLESSLLFLADSASEILRLYLAKLKDFNLMDFTSLVVGVLNAFKQDSIKQRWQNYYKWIELDEVQDTNKIEYKIIKTLFEKHSNIALFGDIHQTIYEWRGSSPNEILRDFKINNPKYLQIRFEKNYRSSKLILNAAESFLGNSNSQSEEIIEEDKIKVRGFKNVSSENAYLLSKILHYQKEGIGFDSQAILTRTNKDARIIGEFLEANNLPVFVMDKTRFFSRDEVKNALAYLKLMINPKDILSLKRINSSIVDKFLKNNNNYYLDIENFLNESIYESKDPYLKLIEAYNSNEIIVFDVETTGLDVKKDKIIQIAALKGGIDGIIDKLERYIKIEYSVGSSFLIHQISDEFLNQNGIKDVDAINDFLTFSNNSVIVGHNVLYDINILKENMKSINLNIENLSTYIYDTLFLSRKIFPGFKSYKLGNLFRELGLNHSPTHNAMDDVICTLELLSKLIKKLIDSKKDREKIFFEFQDYFYPIARNISLFKELSFEKRPQELLHEILIKSGLIQKYSKSSIEMSKLRELYRIFREYDDERKTTMESLIELLEIASLGNDTDRFLRVKKQLPVITIHQAKGLEFDVVYMYNTSDNNFPSKRNQDLNGINEEKRLFYVALTRAKSYLFITYNVNEDENSQFCKPSRFIHQIERKYIDFR